MKSHVIGGLVLCAALTTAGCVSKGEHTAVLAEVEGVKSELERTRAQKNALEQQVKTLKDLNAKFGNEAQAARDELQRIEHSRDKDRTGVETKGKELELKVKELAAHNRSMKAGFEDVKRHNETLKSLVARYQKELKERPRTMQPESPGASSLAPLSVPSPVPSAPAAPSARLGEPAGAPNELPTPPQRASSPMNVNKASAGDMVLFLGLTKDVAERVVTNRPYRLKGELVAKNVVPKQTFDMIKDRITVTP